MVNYGISKDQHTWVWRYHSLPLRQQNTINSQRTLNTMPSQTIYWASFMSILEKKLSGSFNVLSVVTYFLLSCDHHQGTSCWIVIFPVWLHHQNLHSCRLSPYSEHTHTQNQSHLTVFIFLIVLIVTKIGAAMTEFSQETENFHPCLAKDLCIQDRQSWLLVAWNPKMTGISKPRHLQSFSYNIRSFNNKGLMFTCWTLWQKHKHVKVLQCKLTQASMH